MQRFIRAAAVAALAAAAPASAWAWDYPGHRIVGSIADAVLQRDHPQTYKKVRDLVDRRNAAGRAIGERSLDDVAVYPDCAKNEPAYCGRTPSLEEIEYVLRNLGHKAFHFTNSPLQQATYLPGGAGTSETDVVQMLIHAMKRLKDGPAARMPRDVDLTAAEAVWLLAHLTGDIHQPLHVGQVYFDNTCKKRIDPNADKTVEVLPTFGGNFIHLDPASGADNLHFYWDGAAVRTAMRAEGLADKEVEFAKRLANETPPAGWEPSGAPETWPAQWYADVMKLANWAYHVEIKGEVGGKPAFPSASVTCKWNATLPSGYPEEAAKRAREQLAKAGYRLAALLHAVLGGS